jgi:hypothetical protein
MHIPVQPAAEAISPGERHGRGVKDGNRATHYSDIAGEIVTRRLRSEVCPTPFKHGLCHNFAFHRQAGRPIRIYPSWEAVSTCSVLSTGRCINTSLPGPTFGEPEKEVDRGELAPTQRLLNEETLPSYTRLADD